MRAPLARIGAAALLAQVLAAGCGAKGTPMSGRGDGPSPGADASSGGDDGPRGSDRAPDARAPGLSPDLAPAPVVDGSRDGAPRFDVAAQDGGATDRGRIPGRPPGAPPCAAEAMAVHGGACPYPVLVACAPNPDARPRYVCYCFAPPSSGKWFCQEEGDGGGVTIATGAR